MTGNPHSEDRCSATDVRHTLSVLMPRVKEFWERPLQDYASAAYDVSKFRTGCFVRHQAMDLLRRCIERAARRSGYDAEDARNAGLQILASPVMQTGPHCLLLIDHDAFYTHLFSLSGLTAHGREWHITYHAATVSFSEKAKKGPGWLCLDGEPLNVFGLPRSRMDSLSICGWSGPYRFALSNAKSDPAPNASAARLLADLPSDDFPSAAEAIRAANRALWRNKLPFPTKLLQLDDMDIADLVADHLEDPQSWLSARFIGGKVAESILDAMDHLNAGPWQGWVRRTTDFFWRLEGGRIIPLRLQDNFLRARSSFEVKVRPKILAEALRQRAIVPSLYTVFLVTSILPGVRVLGGCRQTIYYPLMRYLSAVGFQRSGEQDLLTELGGDDRPGVWGHRVLKSSGGCPYSEMELLQGAVTPLGQFAEMSLLQSSGDLSSFTRDPIWANLSEHISTGAITANSPAWQWS